MRETTRSGVLAGLAVLAVALAAATLDSTVSRETRGPTGYGGLGGDGRGGLLPRPRSGLPVGESVPVPFLSELLALLTLVLALAALVYVLGRWRRVVVGAAFAAVLFGLAYLLFQVLFPLLSPQGPALLPPGNGSFFGGAGGGGGSESTDPVTPSLVLLLVLTLVLGGAVATLFGANTDDEAAVEESEPLSADAAAVGRAAGRAADRIERRPGLENEVYRAWREMTGLLDVEDPASSTPGEFAAAATDAGLGREDVDELTRLFEDVRYGRARPSEARERRAVEILRRIEDRYAGEGP